MSRYRETAESLKISNHKKPTWGEILLTKETLTIGKILVGFAVSYVLAAIWYGIIELKNIISR